ncbi:MAG: HAMP domain-containing histidine kinase [Deltaproteobacteria bacterium]|nr:HAMP domain-containing histidine kinase [Deltaproteobacteria bacterium]
MRFPVYSLRTGILTQLTFLILAAMLLINVVMVKFSERDLIQAKVNAARLLIHALEQNIGYMVVHKARKLAAVCSDPRFNGHVAQLLADVGFSETVIINRDGTPVFTTVSSAGEKGRGLSLAREAMETGIWSIDFSGMTWGVVWLNKKEINISAPLLSEGRPLGGISISASLIPIYQNLRKSEKVILLYILLDTLILALVGIYLLSRIVVKPIHKLSKMTEEYKAGDMIPSTFGEASGNEIGQLSRSLSIMLKRLDENKRELKANISSLEKSNKELRQAQNEIIRSEKLASVGRLAAGIAHEIGNPIGIILGYLELLNKNELVEWEKKDFLNRIESEITRINRIIRQLLDFSRPSNGNLEETHAHDTIMNTVNILSPQPMMEGIQIILELRASRDTILSDPNHLQQVFLNIIMNAADALAEKNTSKYKDSGVDDVSVPFVKKELTIRSEDAGDSIELRFIDNGPGTTDEELVHFFDPFYTTKEPGKGTGLGLSVCYRIVEGIGGTIRAENSAGKGTTIIVTFPTYKMKK